jgi:serine/threonine protein phosphatase PrpC
MERVSFDMSNGDMAARFVVESGKASHQGKVRSLNEDAALILEYRVFNKIGDTFIGIFAVADGVGGHDDGEVASDIAIKVLSESLMNSVILPGISRETQKPNTYQLSLLLNEAVKEANRQILAFSQQKSNSMGSTLTAMLMFGPTICVANVGDSRLYLLRDGSLRQITTDHSLVSDLVTAGELNKEEIYTHPHRNVITRCLGMRQNFEADIYTGVSEPGDSFIICSDGLWEMVRDGKISEIVGQSPTAQAACDRLVEEANQNGGADNVTVVAVKVI